MTELHPIQLRGIVVKNLSITVNDPKVAADYEGQVVFGMQRGVSEFERGRTSFAVGLRVDVKPETKDESEPSFEINVELSGQFTVDFDQFDFDDLPRWSEINAPLLLIPYVREQVYGLALRAGVKGMMIPLVISRPARKKVVD
ncbi:protein-export chaperone SecB [Comamonas sp.]|uniref:protein-export chaperone SecB n=1 Tax=Comamonas sp. TaxID=34028 RepID=UPI003D0F40DE